MRFMRRLSELLGQMELAAEINENHNEHVQKFNSDKKLIMRDILVVDDHYFSLVKRFK